MRKIPYFILMLFFLYTGVEYGWCNTTCPPPRLESGMTQTSQSQDCLVGTDHKIIMTQSEAVSKKDCLKIDYNQIKQQLFFPFKYCNNYNLSFIDHYESGANCYIKFYNDSIWTKREVEGDMIYIEKIECKAYEIEVITTERGSGKNSYTLSFSVDGLLRIKNMKLFPDGTDLYIGSDMLDSANCVFTYRPDSHHDELAGECILEYGDIYVEYFTIRSELAESIQLINNFKGTPLRGSPSVQSRMSDYLLENQPVMVVREVDVNWVKVTTLQNVSGYVLKRDLKANNLYFKKRPQE
ncbi:SH3 domain-containing protein [Prolixibacteraceae bacterium]|nr:SH3 domain-containing protein [Prolixibacteraceae bacterium]